MSPEVWLLRRQIGFLGPLAPGSRRTSCGPSSWACPLGTERTMAAAGAVCLVAWSLPISEGIDIKTMSIKKHAPLAILTLVLLLTVVCCRQPPREPVSPSSGGMEGTIAVSGAWALYPLMVRWGEEFQKLHPDVRFDISAGGAGKGMADALANAVEVGMVSRGVYPEEIEKGAFWVSVTKDAVFLTVNEQNPVWEELRQKGIARNTLVGIYITGDVTTWGQVVGRPEVTDPVHVFTRSDACGAAATWAEYLGGAQEDLLGIAVYGDPGLLDAVIKDPLGIGYNNLNYAFDMDTGQPVSGARVASLDVDGDGRAGPDETYDTKAQAVSAVATGRYPSPPARDLNLVTLGQPSGLVRTFIEWVLTNGQDYVGEAGYITLPEVRLGEELRKLD
jgi:phosphate transport system substrate-binding protein